MTTTIENVTLSHGGKLYVFSYSTEGKVVCAGCGREFKNFRGLMSHANHRNAVDACKPVADTGTGYSTEAELDAAYDAREDSRLDYLDTFGDSYERQKADARTFKELDDWYGVEKVKLDAKLNESPRYVVDGVEVDGAEAEAQAAIDAEDYSDARLAAALEDHMAEEAAARFGSDDDATSIEVRDEIIANARRYTRVPEFRTTLVHLTGIAAVATEWAWRWHPEDAAALLGTAHTSKVVKITKHDEGRAGETIVTEYEWNDGLRARMTDRFPAVAAQNAAV